MAPLLFILYIVPLFLSFHLNEHKYDLCNSKGMSMARVTMKNEAEISSLSLAYTL